MLAERIGPGRARCPCCGERYSVELAVLVAGLCCLAAPRPSGWCAWCGDELEGESSRVFCSRRCSLDYTADVAPDFTPIAPFAMLSRPMRALHAERGLALEERGETPYAQRCR